MTELSIDPKERPTTSTRDPEDLRARLESWIAAQPDAPAGARVVDLTIPQTNGMSSETLLFALESDTGESPAGREPQASGGGHRVELVARLAPDPAAVPVFPEYDMDRQARTMQVVAERSGVPVPNVRWIDADGVHLGAPGFVMERIDGIVPPDIMPYSFGDSWLHTAGTAADRKKLQDLTVGVLADLHAIPDARAAFDFLPGADADSALRTHVDGQYDYYRWTVGDRRGDLLERAFAWLEANWPEPEGDAVLSWGDARIGNVLYRDFEPVAVLDWEMAAVGPRELDLGWLVGIHRFFHEIAIVLELPGMIEFLHPDDIAAEYERRTGYAAQHLEWYSCYAAVRHGIVMTRIGLRAAHFGEGEIPENLDELVTHRDMLERMIANTYWQ